MHNIFPQTSVQTPCFSVYLTEMICGMVASVLSSYRMKGKA